MQRRMFTGRETRYHVLNAQVITGAGVHKNVSVEVRDGVAKIRTGSKVLEELAGATKVYAHDPNRATITFEDGTTWDSQRVSSPCGCG